MRCSITGRDKKYFVTPKLATGCGTHAASCSVGAANMFSRSLQGHIDRGADKSLARPGRKQATATEDFDFHVSYL